MTFAATTGVPAGTYSVTIAGSSTGFPDQSATLSVNVIAPPATTTVSVPFCTTDTPAWFAYQNEGYNWQPVSPTGNTFSFAATAKLSVAYVFAGQTETQFTVFQLTRSEFSASNDRDCDGSKNFTGTVAGVTTGQSVQVAMGAASATVAAFSAPSYALANVAARPLDLVATKGTISGQQGEFMLPDRMIIRRSLDLPTGTVIPVLDFSAPEAFAPAGTNLSISGLQTADRIELQNTVWTKTSTFGTAHTALLSGATSTLYSAPAAQLAAGDLHELYIDARQSSQTLVFGRSYVEYFAPPSDKTVPLGPQLSTPTISMVTNAPYPRMRGLITVQPEYNTSVQVAYIQDFTSAPTRIVVVGVSAAFLGGASGSWDTVIPDFTGIAGFNVSWMLAPNITTVYSAEAFSGRTDLLFGALPALGDIVNFAYRAAFTSTSPFYVFGGAKVGRRLPQYLRR
jgi:hypothetical protein